MPEPGICTDGTVIHVLDGDTVRIKIEKYIDVRIDKLKCDELKDKDPDKRERAIKARVRLIELVKDRMVRLFVPASSRGYIKDILTLDRVVGDIYIEGQNVSKILKDEGLCL